MRWRLIIKKKMFKGKIDNFKEINAYAETKKKRKSKFYKTEMKYIECPGIYIIHI